MKISVVLSNYNGEDYLSEAIQSVLGQEYDAYEFVIVDDGSTDRSPDIIRRFAEAHPDRIVPVLERENQGQAAGFNKGVAHSSGEIVAFLDSDDIWMPGKLSKLKSFIDIIGPAALYQHNLFFLKDGVKTNEPYRPLLYTGDLYAEICQTRKMPAFVPTSGLAFPRSVLDKVLPIPVSFRTCADGFLTRSAFCHGRVASACEAWGYYRVHEKNCVFENPDYDSRSYRNNLLIPSLNRYYESIGAELRYPSLVKLKQITPKTPPAPETEAANPKAGNEAERESAVPVSETLVPITGAYWKEFFRAFLWRLVNVSLYDVYAMLKRRLENSKLTRSR